MALPTSGPLTLADIQTEFGGVNPIGLNEYYAGGGRVPPGTTGTYGAVPSSGTISIRNFYGTSAATALAISVSPSSTYNTRVGAGSLTSDPVTGTASGGAGGYTYAWTRVSGDVFTINSPTSATTTFTTSLAANIFKSGVYRCTVTDSLSNTASGTVTVELESV
jgi:hypothetical protein